MDKIKILKNCLKDALTINDNFSINKIINYLKKLKEYKATPFMLEKNITERKMVEYYGVDWNLYSPPYFCMKCKEDFRDYKNVPPFKKEIAIYDLEKDRTMHFLCPNCGEKIEK